MFLFSSDKYPEVELLDYMVDLLLVFWGNSILFSLVAVPIYVTTNSVTRLPFLHILANICYCRLLDNSHSDSCVVESISLWFWLAFPPWLVMWICLCLLKWFQIPFSCARWPPVCLFWQSVYSHLLPIFKSYLKKYWTVWVLYIFWISVPYQRYRLQIFSPIQWVAFLFSLVSFAC